MDVIFLLAFWLFLLTALTLGWQAGNRHDRRVIIAGWREPVLAGAHFPSPRRSRRCAAFGRRDAIRIVEWPILAHLVCGVSYDIGRVHRSGAGAFAYTANGGRAHRRVLVPTVPDRDGRGADCGSTPRCEPVTHIEKGDPNGSPFAFSDQQSITTASSQCRSHG